MPAAAVPILFTAGGTLGVVGGGGDPIGLSNSTVRISLLAESNMAPASTLASGTEVEAHYVPTLGTLSFTNRPGGRPNLSIPYTPDLVTRNVFAPSATPDSVEIDDATTTGVPGATTFYVAGFRVSFIDATIYPGTAPGPLPEFDVTGGAVVFGVFYDLDHVGLYPLNSPYMQVEVVPEPASGALLGLALAGLVSLRRRLLRA